MRSAAPARHALDAGTAEHRTVPALLGREVPRKAGPRDVGMYVLAGFGALVAAAILIGSFIGVMAIVDGAPDPHVNERPPAVWMDSPQSTDVAPSGGVR